MEYWVGMLSEPNTLQERIKLVNFSIIKLVNFSIIWKVNLDYYLIDVNSHPTLFLYTTLQENHSKLEQSSLFLPNLFHHLFS